MPIIEDKLKDYVWEHFILFEYVFSEKIYKNLLQFRVIKDRVTFDNLLETFIEIDSKIIDDIKDKYKPIDDMSADEIIALLGEYERSEVLYKKTYEDIFGKNYPKTISISENLKSLFDLNTIYLEAIKIKDYFSIKDMEIKDLKDKKEIYFVGENGEGKTILLQAIALALKGDKYEILAEDYIKNIKNDMNLSTKDSRYDNDYNSYKNVMNLFAYGINRNKISNNEEDTKITSYSGLFDTPSIYKTTLLRDAESFLKQDIKLVNEFRDSISFLMDKKFRITRTKNGLKYGEIEQFSMLSEGYKTTLIWLSDLLSRMIENQPKIKKLSDFQAIVLIDEVDLYLHPKWKYDFVHKLRKIFPKIQFIMTTHSLITVLGASEDAVFYKVYKEDGESKISKPMDNIKNLMSNNLSTSPLFDMNTARARNNDNKPATDEDYIYTKIHQVVSKQMKNKKAIIEDEIVDLIDKELEDYLKEQGL